MMDTNTDAYWHRRDELVDELCDALRGTRTADQMLKSNYAARFKAYKGSMGVEEAKQAVLADREYMEAHGIAVEAEVGYQRARLKLETHTMRFQAWQTESANRRRV